MAVIPSPLSNSIQGINQSTVSGSIFGGNKVDAQTQSSINANTSAVASMQKQVNELSQTNAQILTNLTQIGSFQAQVDSVRLQLNGISDTLQSVATITASESALEKQKDLYEQEQQKRLAEAGARGGKESLLETKIQSALSEPVKRIGNKISFGFNNLMGFIWTLLGGWLTLEGIKVLKALQDGNKKKLNEIKDGVIKTLLVAGGVFTIISVGIGKVIGTITGLVGKIGKFVIANTVGKLFQGMAGLVKGAARAATGGAKEAKAATKGVTSGAEKSAGEGLLSGIGKVGKGIAKAGFNLALGGFDFMERKKEGQTNIQAGAGAAGSLATAEVGAKIGSKFPGPLKLPATLAGSVGGYIFGGKGVDILTGVDKSKSPKPETAKPAPKTSMTPLASNLQIKASEASENDKSSSTPASTGTPATTPSPAVTTTTPTTASAPEGTTTTPATTSAPAPSATAKPEPAQVSAEMSKEQSKVSTETKPAETSSKLSRPEITPAQTTKMQTVPFNIGPEPEPKPNVVYAPSGSSAPQQQQPSSTGAASDVPSIPSSNTDNFYTLYSQINYNVVL